MSEPLELDLRRLLCPLPVIRTQDRVRGLATGDRLILFCTDPGVLADIPAWCRINGHTLISCATINREIHITLEVGAQRTSEVQAGN